MASTTILSDNGVSSGSAGIKTTGGDDGKLLLQTTTAGGTATTAMTIDTSQNVGIGGTPDSWTTFKVLQLGNFMSVGGVNSTSANTFANTYYDGAYKYSVGSKAALRYEQNGATGYHAWSFASGAGKNAGDAITFAEAMRIDGSGNVGIGTNSPATKLHVASGAVTVQGATSTTGRIGIFNNAASTSGFLIGQGFSSGTDNIGYVYNTANAAVAFGTNDIERMRIDSSGNLLVGTTAYFGAGLSLGSPASSGCASIFSAGGSGNHFRFGNVTNGIVGSISTTTSATTYSTSSDYRLKENIQPMTGALSVVQQLKPVTYNWKSDGSDGQGFIAHELQAVVPDCVIGEKDAVDEDGNPQYQGIDTSFLVATLTAAIQEQQAIITTLTERITALEGATQ